jgi:heme A synthase
VIESLLLIHPYLGYAVSVLVLIAALVAFKRAKDGREFEAGLFRVAYILLSLQVLTGIVLYGLGGYWDAAPLIAYVHPALGIVALGIGQALLGRARKTQMAADAHRLAGRGLVITLVLVLVSIGVASAPV